MKKMSLIPRFLRRNKFKGKEQRKVPAQGVSNRNQRPEIIPINKLPFGFEFISKLKPTEKAQLSKEVGIRKENIEKIGAIFGDEKNTFAIVFSENNQLFAVVTEKPTNAEGYLTAFAKKTWKK